MEQGSVVHRQLSFKFLEEITNGFSNEQILGHGSYGTVYKGECKNEETIAVKVLRDILGLDDENFEKEYLNLASLQHKNIVRVVAYCHETRRECVPYNGRFVFADNTKRALCFEYMHNGSLDNYLSDESSGHDWQTRYQIIRGICEGLKYLHEDLGSPMYHLDLKPANVLLDQDFVPKIADFGLSRLIGGEQTQLTKSDIGTLGYRPPEYIDEGLLSIKFDIYSLGVVIIKIMTGPLGYFRAAEMPSQEFIELVLANWRNRLLAASVNMLESSSKQVKRCIEIALSCVEANRRKRPCIGVIINKLIETEDMIRIPGALRKDTGSSMDQVCHSKSNSDQVDRLPCHPNFVTVSRAHIVSLFNSTAHRLSDVPENPWILRAGTERFADPRELTNESTGIWVMKLKTTTELVCLSKIELNEQNWELCEEVKEKCLEQLFEVVCSFTDARWSLGQFSHQVTIFDALVDVLFSIRDLRFNRSGEVAGIINKMVNAFDRVIMRTSLGIHRSKEFTTHPATAVLIQVLDFFGRNGEKVQSILKSGDYHPCSDMLDCWLCKVKQDADILFQEKGQSCIFIMNNTYYVLQMICRPGSLLPDVASNLLSLINQYTVSCLDECWLPPMSYMDGDSLNKPHHSSLDKFTEEFSRINNKTMNAFNGVIMQTSIDIHRSNECTVDPATDFLMQVLAFFGRHREMVQSIFKSGDYNPCSDILDCWLCKVKQDADKLFQEKGQSCIFIMNNASYVLQMSRRPGSCCPFFLVESNLLSVIKQYNVSYLDECWLPLMSYLDGDSLNKPQYSSLDKFTEEFNRICSRQMKWGVTAQYRYRMRSEICELVVPKYVNFLGALKANPIVGWRSLLNWVWRRSEEPEPAYIGKELECVISQLFEP